MTFPPGSQPPFGAPQAGPPQDPRFPAPPSAYAPPVPAAFSRPFGVIMLAILNAMGALLFLGGGVLMLVVSATMGAREDGAVVVMVMGGLFAAFGAFHAVTALGLFMLKGFGRVCQMVQSGIGLLAIPLGTLMSGLILYYLTRPGVALLFSGRPPAAMTPEERQLVARDSNQGVLVVVLAIVAVFGGIAVIGIVAAIAIPGLLRARMAGNEASALGTMRAMASAQAAYSATHDGRYGTLECLTTPAACSDAGGTAVSTPFISADMARPGPRSGYVFRLLVSDDQQHFVYWGEPAQDRRTGEHAFCVSETHSVFQYQARDVFPPTAPDGGCPSGGETL